MRSTRTNNEPQNSSFLIIQPCWIVFVPRSFSGVNDYIDRRLETPLFTVVMPLPAKADEFIMSNSQTINTHDLDATGAAVTLVRTNCQRLL